MESTSVDHRLDALDSRLSWFYIRLLLLTGVSWAVHAAELVLFTFTRQLIAHNVGMGTHALEALGVGVFLGSACGGPLFGYVADTRGRRLALLLAMTLSLAGLALSAVAQRDYHVIAARVVAGIGLGGELPAATVLVQELAPKAMRGRMVALLEAFTGIGGVVGVALAFGLAPQLGWRVTYLAICGCVLYAGVLRFGIPESPRWLASVGRVDEALAVVEKLEHAHGKRPLYDHVKVLEASTPVERVESAASVITVVKPSTFKKPVVHTLVLWTLWSVMAVSSYALGVYVPTLISLWGFNMFASWGTLCVLSVAQVFGCVLASNLLDIYGRKIPLVSFAILASAISLMLSHLPWHWPIVLLCTCSVRLFLGGSWSCVLVLTTDSFETAVRGRGVGYSFGFSRLMAIVGALLYPHMFNVWLMSVSGIAWVFAGLLVVVVVGIAIPFGPSQSQQKLGGELRNTGKSSHLYRSSGLDEEGLLLVPSDTSLKSPSYS